jgi:hypothetical protein
MCPFLQAAAHCTFIPIHQCDPLRTASWYNTCACIVGQVRWVLYSLMSACTCVHVLKHWPQIGKRVPVCMHVFDFRNVNVHILCLYVCKLCIYVYTNLVPQSAQLTGQVKRAPQDSLHTHWSISIYARQWYVCVCVCVRARTHTQSERFEWSAPRKTHCRKIDQWVSMYDPCVCVCVRARTHTQSERFEWSAPRKTHRTQTTYTCMHINAHTAGQVKSVLQYWLHTWWWVSTFVRMYALEYKMKQLAGEVKRVGRTHCIGGDKWVYMYHMYASQCAGNHSS